MYLKYAYQKLLIPAVLLLCLGVGSACMPGDSSSKSRKKADFYSAGFSRADNLPERSSARSQAPTISPGMELIGLSSLMAIPFIHGGIEVTTNEWQWMTSLLWTADNMHLCGGTLIQSDYVLTAAHCLKLSDNPSDYYVSVGLLDLSNLSTYGEKIRVEKIFVHGDYNRYTKDNDIALLKLSRKSKKKTIDGFWAPDEKNSIIIKKNATIIGWGKTESGVLSKKLRQAEIPIVAANVCRETYGKMMTNNMFCAGHPQGGKGGCQGDSGGPIFFTNKKGKHYQVGIVSWGHGCAMEGYYGVYTKVTNYRDWLEKIIGKPL